MEIAIIFLVLVGLLFISIRISMGLARGAICKVINTFREKQATRPEQARTLRDLGLERRLFTILRDYKPWALATLVQAGVVRPTPIEDMYYLSESELEMNTELQCKPDLPRLPGR